MELHVSLQTANLAKLSVTHKARIRFIASVRSHMNIKVADARELLVALDTLVQPVGGVHPRVAAQVRRLGKGAFTLPALVRAFAGVAAHVDPQRAHLREHLGTDDTDEWTLASVSAGVRQHVDFACKVAVAVQTCERFFPGVRSHVSLEIACLVKLFRALGTRVHLLLLWVALHTNLCFFFFFFFLAWKNS